MKKIIRLLTLALLTVPVTTFAQSEGNQNPGWKTKNFMSDDDEFEFEFLNWDGDEDQ